MLSNEEKWIFNEFVSKLRVKFPNARVWAFGSRARGDATGESDIDVCVVVDTLDDESEIAIMDIARQIGLDHDVIITTVIYSQESFENAPRTESGLIHYILCYGVPGPQ
jgi:predicted nucleotidyltransferase